MDFLTLPFFKQLENSHKILLAGAGGGFDIFCGLPLYFGLRQAGKEVFLANLSFSNLAASTGRKLLEDTLFEVGADTKGNENYFPELHLARWLKTIGLDVPVYGLANSGVVSLTAAYNRLVEDFALDTVILVDGGTDSLMRGDEWDLGSPQEDVASILAVSQLKVACKLLVCLGFGIDGISHVQVLEAVAELSRRSAFLGAWTLSEEMVEVQLYRKAAQYAFAAMPHHPSIISASVLSAVEGRFGNFHATHRTAGSELFINPLMTLYWCFQLPAVAERLLYPPEIRQTVTRADVTKIITAYRIAHHKEIKGWETLPM